MNATAPLSELRRWGIRTSHHYVLLAIVVTAFNLAADFKWSKELYLWAQIDALIIVGSALGYAVFLREPIDDAGKPRAGGPERALFLVIGGLVLFNAVGSELAVYARRILNDDYSMGGMTLIIVGLVYDFFARSKALLTRAGDSLAALILVTSLDLLIMYATGVIRLREPAEIDPWLIPRCYAVMALGRFLVEWFFAREVTDS